MIKYIPSCSLYILVWKIDKIIFCKILICIFVFSCIFVASTIFLFLS